MNTLIHANRTAKATSESTMPTSTECQKSVPTTASALFADSPMSPKATPVNSISTVSQNERPERRSSASTTARELSSTAAMTTAITPEAPSSSAMM